MSEEVDAVQAMSPRGELCFGRWRLAGPNGPLRADGVVVELPRKPLTLLWLLASRAGEVLTKDALLAAVWPRVVVTEGVISTSLRDLRRVLGDDAREPRFIATVHRIGYRFIAQVTERILPVDARPGSSVAAQEDAVAVDASTSGDALFGRDAEQAALRAAYARACGGQRQLVFVTGEAGIGKSRLVEGFVASLQETSAARIGHGQCIEHYGAGEPYLPILEAVSRLCRQPDGGPLLALLRRHAPTWLLQLPGLVDDAERAGLQQQAGTGSVQRMLREMAEMIETAAAERPLVLVLEDMHWSDSASVDWLSMLVRRREPAQLLVIATCRPVELIVNAHPLKRVKHELVSRGEAGELRLGYLAAVDVRAYVEQRLQRSPEAGDVAAAVYRRSQGHPLFMVHMADDLQARASEACIDERSLPCGVGELIEAQLLRLAPAQLAALEAGSVAGADFSAASVAAALQQPGDETENLLEALAAHQQFIEPRGLAQWHDGTVSGCYGFRHDLYREGLYRRLGAARRVRLHGLIGTRLATAYGEHTGDIAAELALHFEHARDADRAARHCRDAADKALHRYACREALAHAEKGLALIESSAADTGRDAVELALRLTGGAALLATRGYSAPEVEANYKRALSLAIALDDSGAIGPALSGLSNLYLTRGSFDRVREIAEQVMAIVQRRPEPVLSMLAHNIRGTALLFVGEPAAALPHIDESLSLYDTRAHRLLAVSYGEDPGIACHHYASLVRWVSGCGEAAERHLAEGFALARSLAHPFGEAQMLWMEAVMCLDDGDIERAGRSTTTLLAICLEHEFPLWLAGGRILHGAVLAHRGQVDEGRAMTDEGMRAWRAAGTLLTMPHALSVAARIEALGGRHDLALDLLDEALALVERTGERWYEAELHRLQGELLLQRPTRSPADAARACTLFSDAIGIARRQGARRHERRADASLVAACLHHGKTSATAAGSMDGRSANTPPQPGGHKLADGSGHPADVPPSHCSTSLFIV